MGEFQNKVPDGSPTRGHQMPSSAGNLIFVSLSHDSRKNKLHDSDITHRPHVNLVRSGFQQIARKTEITFGEISFCNRNKNQ